MSRIRQDLVIDLTGSDDEDIGIIPHSSSITHRGLPTRPSPTSSRTNSIVSDIPSSRHGLIISPNFDNLGALRHGSSASTGAHTKTQQVPKTTSVTKTSESPKHARSSFSPFKRVRLDGVAQGDYPQTALTEKKTSSTTEAPCGSGQPQHHAQEDQSQQTSETPVVGGVLRQQVFPHIIKSLKKYEQSIDPVNRNEIGREVRRVLTQQCSDNNGAQKVATSFFTNNDDFHHNYQAHGGQLSPSYETSVADKAQRLVDALARRFLSGRKGSRSNAISNGEVQLRADVQSIATSPSASSSEDEEGAHGNGRACTREASSASTLLESDHDRLRRRHSISSSSATSSSSEQQKAFQERTRARRSRPPCSISPSKSGISKSPSIAVRGRSRKQTLQREGSTSDQAWLFKQVGAQDETSTTPSKAFREATNFRLASLHLDTYRPYLLKRDREDLERGTIRTLTRASRAQIEQNPGTAKLLHVDFAPEELSFIARALKTALALSPGAHLICDKTLIHRLMRQRKDAIGHFCDAILAHDIGSSAGVLVRSRSREAIENFLRDAASGDLSSGVKAVRLRATVLGKNVPEEIARRALENLSDVLLNRAMYGNHRSGMPRKTRSYRQSLANAMEDTMVRRIEWSGGSGDIDAFAWTSNNEFLVGAIAHSDDHNQQYNKPGNLLVGSTRSSILRSVDGHRAPRPKVATGANSLPSMIATQDPWLHCSVPSTAYSPEHNLCFSASYDDTVKVWQISREGSLDLCGHWEHEGRVNFVMASANHGMIATAADVGHNAIRVYDVDPMDITMSPYDFYSSDKADEMTAIQSTSRAMWSYYPATMQWGKSPSVEHLLLVGFSPRSYDCDDIPEEFQNTGELCLFDVERGRKVPLSTARTQNVFEVTWHPSQPIFVAATSATGDRDDGIHTQLRLFAQTSVGAFIHLKTLDCTASDINGITIFPNSLSESYVTASCTDGNTYVWDTAQNDKPIHVLSHGESIDTLDPDLSREEADVGVKLALWGSTMNRFYTGSSDGIVKAWNPRMRPGQAFVRDVITLSGGISAMAFSPDFETLAIGDSTGKVHLLSVSGFDFNKYDEHGECVALRTQITYSNKLLLDDGLGDNEQSGIAIAREFVSEGQLCINPNPIIGAIQGPCYASLNLYCPLLHDDDDITHETRIEELEITKMRLRDPVALELPRLRHVTSSDRDVHEKNYRLDLRLEDLSLETTVGMGWYGIDFDFDVGYDYDYDYDYDEYEM